MTGDMDKNRKQKPTDESSSGHGICRQMNESNSSSTPRRNGEEQPLFKKPRLDVSFLMQPEFQCDDGSIILRNCESVKADDGKGQECSTECVGECSTCGDTGFQSELFRCTKCSVRLQHTYCSNSYNPRKRWFIGLCNWCEMDVARAATPGGTKQAAATPTHAGGASKRDSTSPWGERRNAVDCLLGAALRLPSAGLSNMEELLPQATRAAKGRRSPSFDTVERAKRSGPSCDSAVKTNKRSAGSLSSSTTTGDGKAQTGGGSDGYDLKDEKPSVLKRLHHHPYLHAKGPTAAGAANGEEGKENLRETTPSSDSAEKRVAKCGGGSESEKLSSTTWAARRSPSIHNIATKNRKSPVGDHDDKSETTVDNTVRSSLRWSPSRCTNASAGGAAKSEVGPGDDERKGKGGSCRSPGGGGEKSKEGKVATAAAAQDSQSRAPCGSSIRRSQDHKEKGGSARGSAAAAGVDRKSPVHSDSSAGGSDCSNVTEVQRSGHGNGHGSSSRDIPLRKSQSFKQQSTQARIVRPSLIIGKSKSQSIETSKTPRKFADLKDSKLRRSSNSPRVTGAHFRCLSDILC